VPLSLLVVTVADDLTKIVGDQQQAEDYDGNRDAEQDGCL